MRFMFRGRWCLIVATGCALSLLGCRDAVQPELAQYSRVAFTTDPAPDSAGYFLAGITPGTCFLDQNGFITDVDRDWLDQNCELELATAFNPLLRFSSDEACSMREPVWAAKYFPGSYPPTVVRIAYMTSYWQDCGLQGHQGDSEMIMVEVMFNPNTQHWVFRQMWTSAHYRNSMHPMGDRSRWTPAAQVEFPDKQLGYPRVYIARDKHGGFPTRDSCNNGAFEWDYCHPATFLSVRDPIVSDRNAGSRYNPFLPCLYSGAGRGHTGRCESYYGNLRFNGWAAAPPGTGGAGAYRVMLMNALFERRDEVFTTWGPGPYPPGWTPYSTSMSGPTSVRPGELCQWFVSSSLSGTPEWLIDGETIGTGWSVWTSLTETTVLSVLIQNGGDHEDDARAITVSPYAPPCSTEY